MMRSDNGIHRKRLKNLSLAILCLIGLLVHGAQATQNTRSKDNGVQHKQLKRSLLATQLPISLAALDVQHLQRMNYLSKECRRRLLRSLLSEVSSLSGHRVREGQLTLITGFREDKIPLSNLHKTVPSYPYCLLNGLLIAHMMHTDNDSPTSQHFRPSLEEVSFQRARELHQERLPQLTMRFNRGSRHKQLKNLSIATFNQVELLGLAGQRTQLTTFGVKGIQYRRSKNLSIVKYFRYDLERPRVQQIKHTMRLDSGILRRPDFRKSLEKRFFRAEPLVRNERRIQHMTRLDRGILLKLLKSLFNGNCSLIEHQVQGAQLIRRTGFSGDSSPNLVCPKRSQRLLSRRELQGPEEQQIKHMKLQVFGATWSTLRFRLKSRKRFSRALLEPRHGLRRSRMMRSDKGSLMSLSSYRLSLGESFFRSGLEDLQERRITHIILEGSLIQSLSCRLERIPLIRSLKQAFASGLKNAQATWTNSTSVLGLLVPSYPSLVG
jgi:hypothetical protein